LLHTLSIEGNTVGSKNIICWKIFHDGINYRCLVALYPVALVRTDVPEEHIVSSQLVARIYLTTDSEESLLHSTPQ
jgi:hypothetical protein